ncbi:MAG: ribonuclease HIII [Streptococcus sp.]|nr:ribonuclease HIII [Streptococcus sp.]
MKSITLVPKQEEIQSFIQQYQHYIVPSKNPHIQHLFKLDQATVSIYTSGKVLFQGKNASKLATFFGYEDSSENLSQDCPLIGSDEVGNGSYFGGLAVVASFVQPEEHAFLRQLGVGDSKTLTDSTIRSLAPILKNKITHQALLLSPQKYNEVIAEGYNAVSIKVALHNQAIFLLLQKGVEAKKIVIDAFTSPTNYKKYLKKEKNHFPNPIDLIEKAEGKYLAVAVSSIIARDLFLENLEQLGQKLETNLPSGASHQSDLVASNILKKFGLSGLDYAAKLHFKNTEKAKKLSER